MKKIVAAWIEQILEFPTKLEYLAYIESLKKKANRKSSRKHHLNSWNQGLLE